MIILLIDHIMFFSLGKEKVLIEFDFMVCQNFINPLKKFGFQYGMFYYRCYAIVAILFKNGRGVLSLSRPRSS